MLKKSLLFTALWALAAAGGLGAQSKPAWAGKIGVDAGAAALSAVSTGPDQKQAEGAALGALTAYFKQSITSSITLRDEERQEGGRTTSLVQEASQTIEAVAALDSLIGVETEAWQDAKAKTWYAKAEMNKTKCALSYLGEISKTVAAARALIDVSGGVALETIAKCREAQALSDKAEVYDFVLSMLGGPNRSAEIAALNADIASTLKLAQAIPVDVRVEGDKNGRIKAAFAGKFTDLGFKTGNRNSRYVLEVIVTMEPMGQGGRFYNTRYSIDAVLTDTSDGSALFTYNIASKSAHPKSQADADNRAFVEAEQTINSKDKTGFASYLRDYLDNAG